MDELIRLRHELHRNPNLSGNERETAKRIKFFLNHYRPHELHSDIAGEGMAAVYNSNEPGPTLLFRCELDALQIQEKLNTPYNSKTWGVAHACGHDGHMAMVSGLAITLKQNPIKKGKVVLLYQPQSENGLGAKKSVKELEALKIIPDFSFALHNMPKYPMGSIILSNGTFASASKGMVIKLTGTPSHAAYPESGNNPSLAIAEIIHELSSITKSESFSSFVLATIIHVNVGEIAFGTSPGQGKIMITLRSFENKDMVELTNKITSLAKKIGVKHELAIEISTVDDFPATVPHKELTETLKDIALKTSREVIFLEEPNRWSEDFSHFTLKWPSILFGMGIGQEAKHLHSPNFNFPDEAIKHGVEFFDSITSRYLR